MHDLDPTLAIDGIRQFLKLHADCGGGCYDMPELPAGAGYRAVVACRCGDTVEFWLRDTVLSSRQLVEATLAARPEASSSMALAHLTASRRAA